MNGPRSLVALGALLCVCAPAAAHVGPLRGTAPFVVDEEIVGGATTWGIVLVEGDRALRVCEESVGEVTAFHLRLDDGRVLVGAESALFVTDDGGCTYAPLALSVPGLPFVSGARALGASTIVVATTSTLARSNDGGDTFAALAPLEGAPILREVVVDDSGARIVASGFDPTTGGPIVFRSDDGGATFHRAALDGFARVIALGFDDDRALASGIFAAGGSALVSLDDALSTETLSSFDGVVTDAAVFDGVRAVIVDKQRYFQESATGAFQEILGGPTGCLARAPNSTRIFGCARFADLVHFVSSDDAGGFVGAIPYGIVEERACPIGTPGRVRCTFVDAGVDDGGAPLVDAGSDGGEADGGDAPLPPICACDATQAPADDAPWACALVMVASTLARVRARRRRASTSGAPWSCGASIGMLRGDAP